MGGDTPDSAASPLRIADIDLGVLAEALSDSQEYGRWWFDATTGEVIPDVDGEIGDESELEGDLAGHHLVPIDSEGSRSAYRDMDRFASFVGDEALAQRLQRALEGRGAFRRFKDELYSMPAFYRERWNEYSRHREEERAIDWLRSNNAVDTDDAEREAAERERLAVAVLDEIEAQSGMRMDVADAPARWDSIVSTIESGSPVTLTRDGEVFAVISPEA